jgi:prophage antirepressor-like protein
MNEQNEIVLYKPDDTVQLEVRLQEETVWLSQAQIAELFGVKQPAVSKHLKNVFSSGELDEKSSYSILEYPGENPFKPRIQIVIYNLDAILSVGYRVNSRNATMFRRWANSVLKEYLLRGYAVNQRIDRLERKMVEHDQKFDLLIKTALPPREGVFYDGQIFDAHVFVSDLVKSAKKSIMLIDNYIDETVLVLLSKRGAGVGATIYTKHINAQFDLDLTKHNGQYAPIEVRESAAFHDRFLIIDDTVYHVGASLKDLGKKLFAFSKMEIVPRELLKNVN